jgi:hypothetical protein
VAPSWDNEAVDQAEARNGSCGRVEFSNDHGLRLIDRFHFEGTVPCARWSMIYLEEHGSGASGANDQENH